MAAAATPRIIVVGGGLAGLSAVMPLQPAGVTPPAPYIAPTNSTNPIQPGLAR